MDEAFWDERYRSAEALWSGNPNPQLMAAVADLQPGRALDVGCGEGTDVIWLAEQGWRVTGVDISAVALGRARDHAARAGPGVAGRTTWLHVDLGRYAPGPGRFDLVSAQFMQLPTPERERLHRRLARAVASGGTLLIVSHDLSDLGVVPRPAFPDLFATAEQVAATLPEADWTIVVAEARPRPPPIRTATG